MKAWRLAWAATSLMLLLASACSQPPAAPAAEKAPASLVLAKGRHVALREAGLYGEFYSPDDPQPHPALLLIGGSEGGLEFIEPVARAFAGKGYATLAVAYWKEDGLPQTLEGIPVEYFDRTMTWLGERPQVDRRRMGVIGWSRGSEAALMLAARNPDVHAVMAVSPSSVRWGGFNPRPNLGVGPAWTLQGRPLPYLKASLWAMDRIRQPGQAALPVEEIKAPILLITGGKDRTWPSAPMAELMIGRLKASGFAYEAWHVNYPEGGHHVFVGQPRNSPKDSAADRQVWNQSWGEAQAFFSKALGAGPGAPDVPATPATIVRGQP